MGPLAVRPERQGAGIGTIIVNEASTWLRTQGAKTIGLETMPRTVDNIGFYSRLGFLPGPLTVTLVGEARSGPLAQGILMSELSAGDRDTLLEACRDLVDRSAPGYDFTREFELMGVQRHLKAAGIFARLNHRDGKPDYLHDIPRTLRYVVELLPRHAELEFLVTLIHERCLPMLEEKR